MIVFCSDWVSIYMIGSLENNYVMDEELFLVGNK